MKNLDHDVFISYSSKNKISRMLLSLILNRIM